MDVAQSRLYYRDADLTSFEARIVEQFPMGENWGVVLDCSAFYPTSGGQPHDTGTLNGLPVVDVVEREEDKAVVHVLSRQLEGEIAVGQVDWTRRFDHMQQHTGQHILSHVFEALLDAETVGFHLTEDALTIDIAHGPLTPAEWEAVEERANELVFADLPVEARFVNRDAVARLPLRKTPAVSGPIRIVQVGDVDYSPCGGTNCRSTGIVGLILMRKIERKGTAMRVDFVCGGRALRDARRKNQLVNAVSAGLSVGDFELAEAVSRLQDELKECQQTLRRANERFLEFEAERLRASAEVAGGVRIVRTVLDDGGPLLAKHLAVRLMGYPATAVVLAYVDGNSVQLIVARSDDVPVDVRPILKEACRLIGGGGGGQPNMAQGGGSRTDQVEAALDQAVLSLKMALSQ